MGCLFKRDLLYLLNETETSALPRSFAVNNKLHQQPSAARPMNFIIRTKTVVKGEKRPIFSKNQARLQEANKDICSGSTGVIVYYLSFAKALRREQQLTKEAFRQRPIFNVQGLFYLSVQETK